MTVSLNRTFFFIHFQVPESFIEEKESPIDQLRDLNLYLEYSYILVFMLCLLTKGAESP